MSEPPKYRTTRERILFKRVKARIVETILPDPVPPNSPEDREYEWYLCDVKTLILEGHIGHLLVPKEEDQTLLQIPMLVWTWWRGPKKKGVEG